MSISPSFHQDRDAKQSMATSAVPKLLIVDPIPFRGGSKIATEAMLAELHQRMPHAELHVVTQDGDSWPLCQHHVLGLPRLLQGRESGVGYLLSQSWQTLLILWWAWRLGRVTCLLAASGPGVDLCCYWAARLLRLPVVQLIHGPVYCSGLSARALWQATRVFYLESCRPSLNAILERLGKDDFPNSWQPFRNGLSEAVWPRQGEGGSGILWAASLLRWKGLETMLAAHQQMGHLRPILTVCYLLPKGIALPCSTPQPELPDTRWYQAPADLDMIRSHCGIFV
ncbi:glycosyl transferase, partial [Aeromonas cavernicola]